MSKRWSKPSKKKKKINFSYLLLLFPITVIYCALGSYQKSIDEYFINSVKQKIKIMSLNEIDSIEVYLSKIRKNKKIQKCIKRLPSLNKKWSEFCLKSCEFKLMSKDVIVDFGKMQCLINEPGRSSWKYNWCFCRKSKNEWIDVKNMTIKMFLNSYQKI